MKVTLKKYIYLIALAALTITVTECSCNKLDEDFINSSTLNLRVKGNIIHKYSPEHYQIGYNEQKRQFRVHNDTMSEYYILTCKTLPTYKGQKIYGSIKWSTHSSISSKNNIEFKVEKIDDKGNIWLWSKSTGIAVSVRRLR